MTYYIISLKHTKRSDKYITLWRPLNCGYCYAKEDAGKYNEIIDGYHNIDGDSLPIEVEKLDELFLNSDIISKNKATNVAIYFVKWVKDRVFPESMSIEGEKVLFNQYK